MENVEHTETITPLLPHLKLQISKTKSQQIQPISNKSNHQDMNIHVNINPQHNHNNNNCSIQNINSRVIQQVQYNHGNNCKSHHKDIDNSNHNMNSKHQYNLSVGSPDKQMHDHNQPYEYQVREQHNNILLQIIKNMHKNENMSQNIHHENNNEKRMKQKLEQQFIPSPISSDEQQSNQAQYLSYIQNPHPSLHHNPNPTPQEDENSNISSNNHTKILYSREILALYQKQQFFSILYQAIVYIRKQDIRNKIDDQLLADRVIDHIIIGIYPNSRSQIGKALLRNGYFVSAYAVLMGRINSSISIMKFIFNWYIEHIEQVQQNRQQLIYYAAKQTQYFCIPQHAQNQNTNRMQQSDMLEEKQNILPNLKRNSLSPKQQNSLKNRQNDNEHNYASNTKYMKSTNLTFNQNDAQNKNVNMDENQNENKYNRNQHQRKDGNNIKLAWFGIKRTESQNSPDC